MDSQVSLLIVDDERAVRQLLIDGFKGKHYCISEASDGFSALDKLRASEFDIVITDISMPKMNGIKLLDEIRKSYPDTYVILITGYSHEYSDRDLLKAGADCCISKPFISADVFRRVNSLAERKLKQLYRDKKAGRETSPNN